MSVIEKAPSVARNNPSTIIYESNYSSLFNKDIDIDIYFVIYKIYEKLLEFIKNISKDEDILNQKYGTSIVSFKLHLLLISVILLLRNNNYTIEDLKQINLDIKEDVFQNALIILEEILEKARDINKLYYAKSKQIDEDIKTFKYKY